MSENKLPYTPWGQADHATEYAPGITFYMTPGHGGFRISAERRGQMHPALRKVDCTYCPQEWYEEDCEWSLVVLAFRHLQCFEGQEEYAHKVASSVYPEQYAAWKE